MDRLGAMAVFVAVAETGGFSAAARQLGMPLTTVSRKIAELETYLKAQLFTRTTRQVTLTDSGRQYLAVCSRLLNELAEAERLAAGEYAAPRGVLHIAAPIVFGRLHVVPIVAEFLQAFPHVDIRMQLADRIVNLIEEHIALAVRIGELDDSAMTTTRIGSMRRIVCASPAYLATHGEPHHPRELAHHDCVDFSNRWERPEWSFRDRGKLNSFPIHARLTVNTAEAAIDAAFAGTGLTRVLSYQAAHGLAEGRLKRVLEDFEGEALPVSLVYPASQFMPLKLRMFLDFAAPKLRARLSCGV
jgi:DNA-binding transcriptional LysR family regulator